VSAPLGPELVPYVMTWQDYTLTMAEILAWPVAVVLCVLILAIGNVRTFR